ncbi:MAG: DUF6502 family protein [Halieaceae bacterium]|jgi:hypothetical protein|nr:DUF6502 family protein [Halieaceae bacterium]
MSNDATAALRGAVFRLLRPLVRVMLRHGMPYGSFAELARKAYVDECLDMLRRTGKRATISSVAAMSGLTRKEASRLARLDIDETGEADQRYSRTIRVITAWSIDPRFHDDTGKAAELPLDGEDSFATLVHDYSGDVPPAAMLATLESGGTVERTEQGVRLASRNYLPTHSPVASLNILGRDVAELITSIDHNLTVPADGRVFQRKVSTSNLRPDAIEGFRALSNEQSQALLESYDAWLSEHEIADGNGTPDGGRYVAVGIYYFDDTLHKDGDDETAV